MSDKRSSNLCSTYMLPLIDLKKDNFGVSNFVNCYVDEADQYIVVELQQTLTAIKVHKCFKFSFVKDSLTYCVFEVPLKHRKAVELFREGKYSMFPTESKDAIIKYSGLKYKVPTASGKLSTSRELLALGKDAKLREVLEEELGVKLDPGVELASIPGEECYYKLELTNQLVTG